MYIIYFEGKEPSREVQAIFVQLVYNYVFLEIPGYLHKFVEKELAATNEKGHTDAIENVVGDISRYSKWKGLYC